MKIVVIFFYIFTLLILRINGVEEGERRLSREDVDEIEKQILLQKKHTIKTIRTHHGDIYDCVNFYKQPAFEHPLLKNHKSNPQKKPRRSHVKEGNEVFSVTKPKLELDGGECPYGTVPIRRVVKGDLIRAKLAQANDDIGYARCSVQEGTRYSGASATLAAYNPKVESSNAYSAAVMKLHFGTDSIEAGWRVDPALYRDTKTRLYIRTSTRNARCFNVLCPGFILTQHEIPLDYAFPNVSTIGGDRYGVDIFIAYDESTQRWVLKFTGNTEIGYWANNLFQSPGNAGNADLVEWGGEVFAPKHFARPGMGSGVEVIGDTSQDAYFSNVKVKNGPTLGGPSVDPIKLKCKAEFDAYKALDAGHVADEHLQYLIFYGGRPVG